MPITGLSRVKRRQNAVHQHPIAIVGRGRAASTPSRPGSSSSHARPSASSPSRLYIFTGSSSARHRSDARHRLVATFVHVKAAAARVDSTRRHGLYRPARAAHLPRPIGEPRCEDLGAAYPLLRNLWITTAYHDLPWAWRVSSARQNSWPSFADLGVADRGARSGRGAARRSGTCAAGPGRTGGCSSSSSAVGHRVDSRGYLRPIHYAVPR